MKKNVLLILILISNIALAQIPNGYYNSATGTGFQLKTQLHNIIKNFDSQSYNALRDLYASNNAKNGFRDRYYENDLTILDIYSENPTGPDPYNFSANESMGSGANEGDAMNREHLIPQSYFNEASPMVSDAFHIWPTDSKVNGWRGNFSFGEIINPDNAAPCNSGANNLPCKSKNGTLKGKFVGNNSITVMEPIDEFKGDVARAFFYFATCYENRMSNFYSTGSNSEVKAMFDGSNNKVFNETFLQMLAQWHIMDPVSQREQDINDLIYYQHQSNRNPYIDHPEYVQQIWDITMNTDDINFQERKDISVYNTADNTVVVKLENDAKSIENISVFDMTGKLVQTQKNTSNQKEVRVKIDKKGIYILKTEGKGLEVNKKIVIK
ncbi:endonuclease [Moheibacter sediminis]|uniref:Por secretion system C-terminal sorting domain-containing protein n=1 Tax=Moheibacter sediminis TaxID=1434700 RepID=A0A1W1ZLY1_9FLAO|nr:endonuclease [Moheibacter sediminis]SMC49555.1 Por secretion system C-terminal sorting domain-containing protein [Moheibacter sediminis]